MSVREVIVIIPDGDIGADLAAVDLAGVVLVVEADLAAAEECPVAAAPPAVGKTVEHKVSNA